MLSTKHCINPLPELDQSISCPSTTLYEKHLEKYAVDDGDNSLIHELSVELISLISLNDEHLLQEIPSSVLIEAASHSP
ncbi:unnamed protein product [Trichobilharzia regenti]|uniref:Uncharacterized protein n=1 Tax=Trichobilharzia regenti TaxID=157069 RepID=A0A183WGF9_TRIRE|nr:unnamed protein product [Trichobilharzia regenti]VDQ07092.1 unnamed protein product [Trichobilharzia regenti]